MKRIIMLAALLLLLSGCKQSDAGEKLNVVCTIFPHYDWTRQILGENAPGVELTLLLDERIDLHSYQPSVEDIAKVSSCDLFIHVGGESDEWIADVLGESANKNMVVVNLLDALGGAVKTEEIIEGMDHEHEHEHEEEHDTEYDEHIWLSPKNALLLCPVIADALSSLDPANGQAYESNMTAYAEKLSALDAEYSAALTAAPVKTLLFGDRFPFRYLVDDYGLDYYAAFAGCSAETEASFETVIFLAGKADELSLKSIMVTESSDQSLAKTIRDSTKSKNQQILVLDAMQSAASGDSATYISLMESNLTVLKDALK